WAVTASARLVDGAGDKLFAGATFAADQDAASGAGHAANPRFEFLNGAAIAQKLVRDAGFVGQTLLLNLHHRFSAGADQGDSHDVREWNGDVEIALVKTAFLEIDVHGAECGAVVHKWDADGVGKVLRGTSCAGQLLIVNPNGFALTNDELRQL